MRWVDELPDNWPCDGLTRITEFGERLIIMHPDRAPMWRPIGREDTGWTEIDLSKGLPPMPEIHRREDYFPPAKGIATAALIGLGLILLGLGLMLFSTFDLWTPAVIWWSACF